MKNIFFTLLTVGTFAACSHKKADDNAILSDVLKIHDKVMAADEQLMKNKMQLDTLIKQKNLKPADTAVILQKKLTAAETGMENWMHKFEPDQTGKPADEKTNYLNEQKKQIITIDSLINAAIAESNKYLKK